MKKCWKIRNDADIKRCLFKLNVNEYYINIILEEDSDPMCYLNQIPKPNYIYIAHEPDYRGSGLEWGWFEEEYFNDPIVQKKYKFCGEINMRKEKLEKLNEKFR